MCGIIGVANAVTRADAQQVNLLTQGLVVSQLRGTDSTGMFQIGTAPRDVYVYKDAVTSTEFVEDHTAVTMLRDVDTCPISVAHVRARTQGDVNKANAHPFTVLNNDQERVIGVHNGSLVNWKTKKDASNYQVDSNWALHHIATNGVEAFEDIQGPFAFVWWDESTRDKLYIARNSQRPLHIIFNKEGTRMAFASEARMLAWVAERSGFVGDGKIREIPVGKLWKFDMSGSKITWESEELPAPKHAAANSTSAGGLYTGAVFPPVPSGYRVFAEQLSLLLEGKKTTASGRLTYGNYSSVGYSSYYGMGSCDLTDLEEEEWEAIANMDSPPFEMGSTGGNERETLDSLITIRLPGNLMPSQESCGVSDAEVDVAVALGLYGGVLDVSCDTYLPKVKNLFCVVDLGTDDLDVVLRQIGKREGQRLSGAAAELSVVIVGVEPDGTVIGSKLNRRQITWMER